ncbi:MAG TPA: hypothetical protein VND45_07080 [Thermoanaerobaculia bacterium]|jgi:hypothetical protein|nr:hypothetical protein [Thermoanaerobaculia bacterium]
MSVVRLANAHLANQAAAERNLEGVPGASDPPPQQQFNSRVAAALDALVRYIPTEIVALYLSALTIAKALEDELHIGPEALYWLGVLATPVALLLVFLANARRGGKPFPPFGDWPKWKTLAATLAFCVWGLAIPGNWWAAGNASRAAIMGIGAIVASFVLSTIGDIVDPDPV